MKILFFSAKPYYKAFFNLYNKGYDFEIEYLDTHLGPHIVNAVQDQKAVCVFVNDKVNAEVIFSFGRERCEDHRSKVCWL